MSNERVPIVDSEMKSSAMTYTFFMLTVVAMVVILFIMYLLWSILTYILIGALTFGGLWGIGVTYHYGRRSYLTRRLLSLDVAIKQYDVEEREQDVELKRVEVARATVEGMLRHRELNLLHPDENGNYPLLLNTPEQFNPHTFHPGNSPYPHQVEAPKNAARVEVKSDIPTCRELIDSGKLLPFEEKSVLGFIGETPEIGSWDRNYSFLVYGASGSGKSSVVSYFLLLAVYHGCRILAIDPESELKDSLTKRLQALAPFMLAPIGDTVQGARRVLKIAKQELDNPGDYPVIWVTDEYSTIMRKWAEKDTKGWGSIGDELTSLLEDYGQRGRKRRRSAIGIGQIATASRTGGTEVKNSMTACVTMRVPVQTARILMSGSGRGIIQECTTLLPGEAFIQFTNAAGPVRIKFPYVNPNNKDMEYAVQKLREYEQEMHRQGKVLVWQDVETDEGDVKKAFVWVDGNRTRYTVHPVQTPYTERSTTFNLPVVDGSTVKDRSTERSNSSANDQRTDDEPRVNPTTTGPLGRREHPRNVRKRRILDLRASGIRNKALIIKEVYGVTKGGTKGYIEANREYEEIMKEVSAQGGNCYHPGDERGAICDG